VVLMAARSSSVPLYKQRPAPQPHIASLPPRPPDFSLGSCASHPAPGWWSGKDLQERRAAKSVCASCPILDACREWSIGLPAADITIYGGLTQNDRVKERTRRRQDELAARLAGLSPGFARDNAMKTECDHGHKLSGANGLYQFSYSTWVSSGGNPADFGHASVSEQNAAFDTAYAQSGTSPWRPYDGC
jgi:Transcription factor WhiB/Transglycosylase-like domain